MSQTTGSHCTLRCVDEGCYPSMCFYNPSPHTHVNLEFRTWFGSNSIALLHKTVTWPSYKTFLYLTFGNKIRLKTSQIFVKICVPEQLINISFQVTVSPMKGLGFRPHSDVPRSHSTALTLSSESEAGGKVVISLPHPLQPVQTHMHVWGPC